MGRSRTALVFAGHLAIMACVSLGQEVSQEITVVASGSGTDEKAALAQAFYNAVTQAVGMVVDSETVVRNDRVISDQILTASSAIVSRYDRVGSPVVKDGVTVVKIKAVIERRQLTERLAAASVVSKPVSGTDLIARMTEDVRREKDNAAVVRRVFQDFPAKVLRAEVVGEPKVVRKTADGGELGVRVRFSVDAAKYAQWYNAAVPPLSKLAKRLENGRWNPVPDYGYAAKIEPGRNGAVRNGDRLTIGNADSRGTLFLLGARAPWRGSDDPMLVIFERQGSSKFAALSFDAANAAVVQEVGKAASAMPMVEIVLRDTAGKEIDGQQQGLACSDPSSNVAVESGGTLFRSTHMVAFADVGERDLEKWSRGDRAMALQILPYFSFWCNVNVPGFGYEFRFNLSQTQISALKSVQLKVATKSITVGGD